MVLIVVRVVLVSFDNGTQDSVNLADFSLETNLPSALPHSLL
jgi:hypothetical protein